MSDRIDQLDSIRGLAALFVLFSHILLIFPIIAEDIKSSGWLTLILKNTPFHLFWGGHQAVLIFFILSGFVLSLAFINGKNQSYSSYIIKRVCRLYIPFIVAILIAVILNSIFYSERPLGNLSNWINNQWSNFNWHDIVNHVFFIGKYNTNVFNGPIWSLVHEMRISIVFPLLMLFLLKFNWKINILMAVILSVVGQGLSKITGPDNIGYFITLHYASLFVLGALLAKHKQRIIESITSSNNIIRALLLILSWLMLTYSYWFFPNIGLIHKSIINDWVASLGALLLISISLSSPLVIKFLTTKPLLYLGKISYSFYLYHFIILLTALYALSAYLPIWLICIISIICTFLVAHVMYWLVEETSIRLGKILAKSKLNEKRRLKKAVHI